MTGRRFGASRGHPAAVVLAAEHLVPDVGWLGDGVMVGVADDDHLALDHHLAVLRTGVVCRALSAPAQCLDLQDVRTVGQLDETSRAGKQSGPEVGQDAEGEHVDLEVVDHPSELVDLASV